MKKFLKENKGLFLLTILITLLPALAGLVLWNRLPDQIAVHFNGAGEADGYASKAFGVLAIPLFLAMMQVFLAVMVSLDPKNRKLSPKILTMVLWITPVLSLFVNTLTIGNALGMVVSVNRFMLLFMGILFVIIGNYMPKIRQNYTVGIRLPWTLEDPVNWEKTHRFGGWVFVACGLVLLLTGLLNPDGEWITVIAVCGTLTINIVSIAIYSYLQYRETHGE